MFSSCILAARKYPQDRTRGYKNIMYNKSVRRYLVVALAVGWVVTLVYFLPHTKRRPKNAECVIETAQSEDGLIDEALGLLKSRENSAALAIFNRILTAQPDNLEALWGKAEVLRRTRDYGASESLLSGILEKSPDHIPSLISLSFIRYKADKLDEAQQIVRRILRDECLGREDQALAYMMLGLINSRRSVKGWVFDKIRYGTQIKPFFLKASQLGPDLAEVHLGLGTFYLLAPAISGGDTSKAIEELELAVRIAPTFATANARLAQGYKRKGDLEKYNFYRKIARELDPGDEAVKEDE